MRCHIQTSNSITLIGAITDDPAATEVTTLTKFTEIAYYRKQKTKNYLLNTNKQWKLLLLFCALDILVIVESQNIFMEYINAIFDEKSQKKIQKYLYKVYAFNRNLNIVY